MLLGAEDFTVAVDIDGLEAAGSTFRRLIHDARAEMKDGCGMLWNPDLFLAKKLI